ncbi:unnamed protein product [Macrosiphum euphorbiae]|uniref:Integrase catalytic domain-containing protein n=1 Tax=Macrosiphum euphorbiae TaxID=13131 RepID=A0AAV0Y0P2_9HEMI|nr:unnamed protein product [Macrosiphum euphorbiae]
MPTNPDPNELRKWKRKIDTLCAIIEDHFAFASQYTSESNNISQVKVRLEEINEFSEKFEEYQAELEMLDEKKDSEWINVRRSFRNRLCDVKAALLKIIDDHVIHPDNVSSPSMSSARSQQHLNTFNSMRYPPCALPTFSGDWQQWSSFIDTFNSMFHNEHSNLPLVQRFHYLRSCLAGQASDVIKSIPTTAEHFQYAYDLLVNRYENKSAIIQSHIRSLLETPKVVSPSCSELQKLHHHVTSNINALKSLQQPVEQWDAWLVTLLCSKMDSATVGEWYLQYKSKDLPSYVAVEQFLANRITAYEAGDMNCLSSEPRKMSTKSSNNKTYEKKALFVKSKEKGFGKCPLCTEHHKLYACSKFNNMSTNDRRNFVMKSRLCFNCLNFGHQVSSCYFPPCPRCGEKHNSKLHEEQANTSNQDASIANDDDSPEPHATAMYTEISAQETENLNVILATAIVNVCDTFGRMHSCRAVLDSGSQLNFITNSCAKRLNLSTASHTLNIVGVSAMASTAKQLQDTIMTSRFGDFKTTIKFYSLQTIVSALPSQVLIRDNLKMPHNILNQLADPNFHSPGPIDVLLGADIFFDVLYGEKFPLSNLACLHRTKLGWIVTGKISTLSTPHTLPNLMIQNQSALSFFTSKTNQRILEEFKAEEHFQSTFRRHCSGRFIVKLPMAQDPKVLGDSLDMAQKRFLNLERRLQKDKVLTEHLPHNQKDPNFMINLTETEVLSALGLLWQPSIDSFRFAMKNWNAPQHISKRTLLSDINSVYDPLGLLSSVLIKGKIFIQQVWSLKVGWDDILSEEIRSKWLKFYSSLVALNGLIIPRLALLPESDSYELHGFCDASQHAYGACIYIRSSKQDGDAEVKLFTARSRVAPIKTTTIPRLELCGALLLSELVNEIKDEFSNINIKLSTENIHLWTDSTIVLAWLNSLKPLQVYVANRVAQINELSCEIQWHHTPTADNPADLISRGVDVGTMVSSELWWQGPKWLKKERSCWPDTPILPSEIPEIRKVKLILATTNKEPFWLLKKYSTWSKLLRTTALVQRFVSNCKAKQLNHERCNGFISVDEMNKARSFWLMQAQSESMSNEIADLRSGKMVHRGSCLKALNPFIDDQGLVRVGGRLAYAPGQYNTKHPIVLPSKSLITKLIFNYEHIRLMHAGPQALLAHVTLNYWPIRRRQIAAQIVRKCVTCFRASPQFTPPLMAPLPSVRVTIARPFVNSGVDLCGPIFVRSGLRKVSPTKSYICVFICMVTRAIHLELVSSLSTEDFLAALSRFMSRRGQCTDLHSDNGTNFVGADRTLKTYFKATVNSNKVHDFLTMREIKWHFIPPASPHFGGLWESAVKSAKKHLLRVSKGVLLTFDETRTLLCQIEAALNSRPLSPLSLDPNDFNAALLEAVVTRIFASTPPKRAVTVRNSTGSEFRRPAIKLSLLPTEKDHDDED